MITRDLVCDIMAAEMAPIQELSETNTRQPQHISAPKPAWGKITQVVETASLSDVMSEQLASRIQETEIELKELVPKLTAITNNKLDTKIYVRGDAIIDYGRVMRVLGELSGSGFTKVALITKPLIE